MVAFIIDNAGEAGIEENKQIYEYAEMAVKNPELLNEDKPGWAKKYSLCTFIALKRN